MYIIILLTFLPNYHFMEQLPVFSTKSFKVNPKHFIHRCQYMNFHQQKQITHPVPKTMCWAECTADPGARTQGIVLESAEYRQCGFISRLFPAIVIWSEEKITDYCQMTHYCYRCIVGPGVVRVAGEPCRQAGGSEPWTSLAFLFVLRWLCYVSMGATPLKKKTIYILLNICISRLNIIGGKTKEP